MFFHYYLLHFSIGTSINLRLPTPVYILKRQCFLNVASLHSSTQCHFQASSSSALNTQCLRPGQCHIYFSHIGSTQLPIAHFCISHLWEVRQQFKKMLWLTTTTLTSLLCCVCTDDQFGSASHLLQNRTLSKECVT